MVHQPLDPFRSLTVQTSGTVERPCESVGARAPVCLSSIKTHLSPVNLKLVNVVTVKSITQVLQQQAFGLSFEMLGRLLWFNHRNAVALAGSAGNKLFGDGQVQSSKGDTEIKVIVGRLSLRTTAECNKLLFNASTAWHYYLENPSWNEHSPRCNMTLAFVESVVAAAQQKTCSLLSS